LGQDYIVKHGGITAHLKNLYGTYNGEKFVEIPADKVNNVKQIITSAHKEYVKALNAARLQRRIPFLNYNKDGLLSEHSRHKTGLFELKEENGKITYLEPSTGKTRIGGEIFPKDLDPKSLLIDFSPDKLVKNGKVMKVPDKINGITKKDWFIHDVQMSGTDKIFKNSNGDLIELTPDSTVGVQIVEVHGDDATVKAFNDGINNLGSNNPFTYPNLVAVDLNNPDTLKDLIDNNVITKDESGGYFIKATVTDANGDVQYGELKLTLPDGSEPLNDRWLKSALIHYFQDTSNPASDIIRMYSTISYNSGSTWKADLASMERIKGKNDINVFGCEHGYGVTFPRYGSIQSYIENLYIKGKNVEIDQELSKVYESYYGLLYDKHALESLQKLKAELIQKNPEDPMIEQMDEAIEIINKQLESSKEAFETEIGPLKDINANKVNDMTKEFDRLFEEGLNDKIFGFSDATFEQLIDKLSKFNDDIAKLLQSTDLRFYTQANELSIDNDVVKELLNELQLYYYTTRKSTSKSVFNMGRNISYNRDNNLLRRNSISYEDNYLIGYDYLIGDIHDYGSNRLPNNNKVYMMDSYTNPPANGILVEDDKYWHELSYIDLVEYVLRPVKEFLLNLSPSDPVQMMVEAITYKVEKQVEFLKANLDRFYTRSQLNVSIFNDYYEMNMLKLNTSLIPSNINGFTIPSINVYITTDLSNIAVLSNGNYTLHPLLNYNGLPNENIFFNVNNYNQEEITHKINNGQIPLPDFNDFDNKYNMFIKLLFNYHQVITQFSKNIEDPFFLDLSSSFLDVASYQSMYSLYLASKLESLANVDKLTGKNGEVISVGQLRLMNLMEMLTNQIYSHDEGSFEFMNQIMLSMIAISKVTNFYQYSRTINSPHGNKIVNLFADFNIINHQYGYVNKLSFTNLDETNQLLLDADYDPLDYFYNQINEDKYYLPTQSSSVFRSVLEEYFTTEGQYLRSDQLVNEFSYSITQFHKDMYKLFDVKEKVFKTKLMQSIYDALKYKDKKYDTQLGWRIIAALNLLNRKHSLVDYPGNKFEIYIYTDSFNTFFGMID
ncbi:MAG: hypothetical protein OEY49_17680, partial [Candidatus Heimdallarchaeota archaeon]|nr:hypothetical protein [Candidatus Heimdallarchaeota archaeon]